MIYYLLASDGFSMLPSEAGKLEDLCHTGWILSDVGAERDVSCHSHCSTQPSDIYSAQKSIYPTGKKGVSYLISFNSSKYLIISNDMQL